MGDDLTADAARDLAREAYLFGLPLVYIDTQINVLTHVAEPEGSRAPINQFAHYREFPDASNKTVVGFNVDTLYSLAQLDVSSEPIVLSVPQMGDRFWIVQVIDGWNNVPARTGLAHGRRQGRQLRAHRARLERRVAQRCHRVADADRDRDPRWPHLHRRSRRLRSRARPAGPVQAGTAVGLGNRLHAARRGALKPGVEDKPVPAQVTAMSPETYFNRLNALLVTNPPEPDDPELMARLAGLGVGPGATFNMNDFDDDVRTAIEEGVAEARQAVHDEEPKLGERVNGWNLSRDLGRYGTKYTYRAAWTCFGVGGNLIEDAFYPLSLVDGDGERYDSANRYTLQFTEEQLPPGRRVLVDHDVRHRLLPGRQPDQPLRPRRPQQPHLRR